ncbi:hypothetical protein C0991_004632 [Blastosporella zonata]|nr:hypothetical protein C0991_004632 [Blastosporella zonata]
MSRSTRASGQPSVASLSLGGGRSTVLDNALTKIGVHVIAAAGNNNKDVSDISPARAPSAITVGASNIHDERALFSNFGPVVDVFAPGESIIGPSIGGPNVCRITINLLVDYGP